MFRINQKVVCVDGDMISSITDEAKEKLTGNFVPILNEIYTVNYVELNCIGLAELHPDGLYRSDCFRAVNHQFGSQIAAKIEEEMVQYQEEKELQTKND